MSPDDTTDRLALSKRGFEEIWGQRNPEAIDRLFAPDFRGHGFPFDLTLTRAQHKAFVRRFQRAFPDCELVADDLRVDDEFVHSEWTFTGTHTGAIGPLPPSGAEVTFEGRGRHRHVDGQISELYLDVTWGSVVEQVLDGYLFGVGD